MEEEKKITVSDEALRRAAGEGMDEFLRVFTDRYLEVTGGQPYIFLNPFAKAMRLMGAKEFSKLVYEAKKIYDAHREDLELERDEDEFMAMYERYEEFDDLEEQFMDMEEEVTEMVAHYVDEHLDEFAEVV